jgi:hypothetical protein
VGGWVLLLLLLLLLGSWISWQPSLGASSSSSEARAESFRACKSSQSLSGGTGALLLAASGVLTGLAFGAHVLGFRSGLHQSHWFRSGLHQSPCFRSGLHQSPWFRSGLHQSPWFRSGLHQSPWFRSGLHQSPWFIMPINGRSS